MSTSESGTAARPQADAPPTAKTADGPRARLLAGMPVVEKHLDLAGIRTAVLEGGAGPPMVLLHGPGEYAAKWLRVIPDLATTHRVITPDLPGHGASAPVVPVDPARVLAWLGELIDRTCPAPPVLVGQILGGAIAARFAARHGDRLRCLILVDPLGLAPFQPAPEFGAALAGFLTNPDEGSHDRLWRHCAFDLDALRAGFGPSWERIKAYNLDRARAPGLKPTQQGLMEAFGLPAVPPAELSRIAVPTILIWGRHDLATPLPVAEAAGARYGWSLHVIDGAADDPPIEQPAAFVATLRHALAATEAGAAARPSPADSRTAWDGLAAGYDAHVTSTHLRLGSEALRRADLRPGMRFLDVAAGSGALAIPAARCGAEVLAIDHAPAMLERCQARAVGEGLTMATSVMDGHALDIADDSFDMAGSQFGVMLFPDMRKGLREMVRVVRPGGRVLVIAFGDPRHVEFLAWLTKAVRHVRPHFAGLPMDPPPLPFQLRDPETLRRELAAAGLREVRVDTTAEDLEFGSGAALWACLVNSNPVVEEMLGGLALTEEERNQLPRILDDMVGERVAGRGTAVLRHPINIGIGTK